MGELAMAFRTGGVWMYLILTAVLVGWPLAGLGLLTLLSKKAKVAMIAGGLVTVIGLGTAAIGVVGYTVGMAEVDEAIERATPENRERLRETGAEYAAYPLKFGFGAASVPLLLGLLTFGAGVMKRGKVTV